MRSYAMTETPQVAPRRLLIGLGSLVVILMVAGAVSFVRYARRDAADHRRGDVAQRTEPRDLSRRAGAPDGRRARGLRPGGLAAGQARLDPRESAGDRCDDDQGVVRRAAALAHHRSRRPRHAPGRARATQPSRQVIDPIAGLNAALGDRYIIDRELGRGGMATVYLAREPKHERFLALKTLRPELAMALGRERFLREIKLAARLQHPNILPVYDSGDAAGTLYYVMPFVEGESLRDRLEREPQLPVEDALQIAHEVADALAYAHSHDVVHRDIKPENIMLSGGHAIVTDFGIARAVSAAGGDKLTQTGLAIGTPAYMSPEQAAGTGHVDRRSDIYSLACVL